ncbi:transmembrane 4 L6 family member 4 isoform X2 [Sminthopsis crassicaudata]|uniref:transmembrane 4 L6 family member 4 isoform X2 n=1 Tax=Sminthopsis crassicaudata TaxID=9301 RepID=UPI003D688DE7
MCHMTCARCVGGTLIPLAISATLTNILLFFPGAKKMDNNINLSEEVWYFGGILGSGVLMLNTMMFLGTGIVGALYAFAISVVAIIRGPKCLVGNNTWEYPFHNGNYLKDTGLWNNCKEPIHIVPWNLSFFSIQLIISGIQISLCGSYVTKICCGVSCKKCQCPKICRGKRTD